MTTIDSHRDPTGTVRSRDGTTIAFDRSGEGPPMIVVGGALTDRSGGAPLAALLEPYGTVYTYDRRGRGDSGDTPPYAVGREVDDLEALIEEAGGSAFVFGMSSGAILALEAAARGLAITKLVLFEPPFQSDPSQSRLSAEFTTQLEELLSADRRGDAVEHFLTTAVGMPDAAVAQMRTEPMWPSLEALAPTLVYDVAVTGDGAVPTEQLSTVATPTLVIDGEDSPDWTRRSANAVADALPDGHRRTLDGQTHDVDPAVLAPAVEQFVG